MMLGKTGTVWRAILYCVMTALFLGLPLGAAQAEQPGGFIVVDSASGRVLDEEDARVKRQPASLTKMMTLYLAFEAIEANKLDADQMLRVSRHAASMPPSELGLKRGDRISLREAIRGAAIKSANDAAVVIAEAIAGDEARFAELMTRKARQLGMTDTTFRNASGLTAKGHVSTPWDMAVLARQLYLDFNDYYWMFSQRSMRIRGRRYTATNTLLGAVPGVDGVKTGYTRAAGYNLAASAQRDGERVFVVRMGAGSRSRRDRDVTRLLDRGFDRVAVLRRVERQQKRQQERGADMLLSALRAAPAPEPRPETGGRVAAAAMAQVEPEFETATVGGDWRIQVGAFGKSDAAEAQLAALRQRYSSVLDAAKIAVEPVVKDGGAPSLYRARFAALDATGAKRACAALKAAGQACALVPPSGWAAN